MNLCPAAWSPPWWDVMEDGVGRRMLMPDCVPHLGTEFLVALVSHTTPIRH